MNIKAHPEQCDILAHVLLEEERLLQVKMARDVS